MVTYPARHSTEELAGAAYENMCQSSQNCMQYLCSPDLKLRLAAIRLCVTKWGIGRDQRVLEACRNIARSEVAEPWRLEALGWLGLVLEGSKHPDFSQFMATLVLDPRTPDAVRIDGYWVLRWIQHGLKGADFDEFEKGMVHTIKRGRRVVPDIPEEVFESLRRDLRIPQEVWDTAEDIDWDFVRRFA